MNSNISLKKGRNSKFDSCQLNKIKIIMKSRAHLLVMLSICFVQLCYAQENKNNGKSLKVPFTEDNWSVANVDGSASEINILEYKGRQAILLEPSQKIYLKNQKIKNFQLEFYVNGQYPGLGFRVQDDINYEYLYLRVPMSNKEDALQYVPVYSGSLPWQLYNYPEYEGNAIFPREQVATLPSSFESDLTKGKASKKLIDALADKGVSFSEESILDFADATTQYIYDPQNKNALIIEKINQEIAFSDYRTWIHIKVKVWDNKMQVYVGDMSTPTFTVADLKRNAEKGLISLISDFDQVYFSNFSIKEIKPSKAPEQLENENLLSSQYLTKWKMSEMFTKDSINFISQIDSLLVNDSKFKPIEADVDGLINISRFYDDMTKTVALKCTITSDTTKTVNLNFDYADYLVIQLNSKTLFDKGMNFQPPIGKGKEGRVFVEDERIELELRKGTNELLFLLSADNRQKFNWGFIAKIKSLKGLSIEQ
ncbi:hypothetical protein [Maribacter sp. IgM3_T14_3]|uniref:hypothetical protein n=1 Tax=Maribacter sp. IgM3_T14_3 TaxID=3415140 RepID=UPI003C6FEF91